MDRLSGGDTMISQPELLPIVSSHQVTFKLLEDYVPPPAVNLSQSSEYRRYVEKTPEQLDNQIEYDMDEEDFAWLELVNEKRIKEGQSTISEDLFELAMDRFEKESVFQCESAADESKTSQIDEDATCSVCGSGEFDTDNTILFCDLCNIAVHQVCYGVPRVPAGPWACRRCTLSPSRAVDCCLCPNGADGGAMKPTDDGRWAHVSCALWIPDISFGCASMREPVMGVDRVAAARWKLQCVVCQRRGGGACLQCRHTSCYTAFHVSCALRAGLCVGVPAGDEDSASFCDVHSTSLNASESQLRLNAARKTLGELQNTGPPLSVPVITVAGLANIRQKLSMEKKDPFIGRLHCYWTLKRRSRNGAPLLRSMLYSFRHLSRQRQLMSSSDSMHVELEPRKSSLGSTSDSTENLEQMVAQLKYWKRLRQDLEKVRLLLELIRKRERIKNEQVKVECQLIELKLEPLVVLLTRTVDQLQQLDTGNVLSTQLKASDGKSVSLASIRDRLVRHGYSSVNDFSADIDVLLSSVPAASHSLKEKVVVLVDGARKLAECAVYEPDTGLHIPDTELPCVTSATSRREKGVRDTATSKMPTQQIAIKPTAHSTKSTSSGPAMTNSAGRPRGRPKKKYSDETGTHESMDSPISEAASAMASEPSLALAAGNSGDHAVKPTPSARTPAGVNRRTAVLFGNKAPRRALPTVSNEPSTATSPGTARRPGRPRKQSQGAETAVEPPLTTDATPGDVAHGKDLQVEESMDVSLPKKAKRGRKKRSGVESHSGPFGLSSQWSEGGSLGGAGGGVADWGSKSRGAGPSETSRAPQKESFRQYRVMNDSDVERSRGSEEEEDEDAGSSSDSSSSSHSDDDEGSDSSSDSHSDSANTDKEQKRSGVSSVSQNVAAKLSPLDLVWAKCRGFPWYPAQVVDPEMPRSGVVHEGVLVQAPPEDVLKLRQKYNIEVFLVTFFDTKRTWRWLPRKKLDPLGVDGELDRIKLAANNKPNVCTAIQRAYDRAIQQFKPARTQPGSTQRGTQGCTQEGTQGSGVQDGGQTDTPSTNT